MAAAGSHSRRPCRVKMGTRKSPSAPGELVKVDDTPGLGSGVCGWKSGPKLEDSQEPDGFRFEPGDVGLVISVWDAPPGQRVFAATRWFCVLVDSKGYSWFPLGWILTADSMPYADWWRQQSRNHTAV